MRWLEPEITAPPTYELVSLDEAKASQRVDTADQDADLQGRLDGAVQHIEALTGLSLATQTIKLRAWGFEDCTFVLPAAPIQSIESITYLDPSGDEQTLDPGVYRTALYGLQPMVSLAYTKNWPNHLCELGSITVTVVAGYADGALPKPIRDAILLQFGSGDLNRQGTVIADSRVTIVENSALDALLTNFRRNA
jgi:uncharacterized phiE125 gp8 family phage protein